jgi:transposase InsO family protein
MRLQGSLTVERMCQLAQVSRAGYYRASAVADADEYETAVRAAIQQIAVRHHRRYGYRRITRELLAQGMVVNHKRVARLMREDNLLAMRWRKFRPTTDSRHSLEVFVNLARQITPQGPNQLWVADITYIRLRRQFVYLAVILDAFSRRVVGWALEPGMQTRLTLAALRQAIAERKPPAGLIHHSDRGVQYASEEYTSLLEAHGIIPSMSRPANPYDNASCESFMRTLKQEEIYAHNYRDLQHLREHVTEFLDQYYNRLRLHSALGYRSPVEFEAEHAAQPPAVVESVPKMSFSRHEEIYPSDVVRD